MQELKRLTTEICVLFSLNLLEYAEVSEYTDFEMLVGDTLRCQNFDAKVHVVTSVCHLESEELLRLLESIGELQYELFPELWFFGSDLNKHVFDVLRHVHANTLIRNKSVAKSSLDWYLEHFAENRNAWAR